MSSTFLGWVSRLAQRQRGSSSVLLFSEARNLAKAQAERYKAEHRLPPDEAAVLDSSMMDAAIFPQNDGTWLSVGLAELEHFREVRRKRGLNTSQEVDILPEDAWPEEWRNEARLTVLFEPELDRCDPGELRSAIDFGGPELHFGDWISEGGPEKQRTATSPLFIAEFWRRQDPFIWKGSEVRIAESSEALELSGGTFSSHTTVTARGEIAAPTFDFVSNFLANERASCSENEALWLAVGLPFDGHSIPSPRPMEPEQIIEDAIRIEQQAPRLCVHVARVVRARTHSQPWCGETLGRWMAVER